MAETQWVCLERQGGRVQRVTLLDDDLKVIASHEREPREAAPDDIQLLRAVEVTGLTAALEAAG
jgi:hypothetical protein